MSIPSKDSFCIMGTYVGPSKTKIDQYDQKTISTNILISQNSQYKSGQSPFKFHNHRHLIFHEIELYQIQINLVGSKIYYSAHLIQPCCDSYILLTYVRLPQVKMYKIKSEFSECRLQNPISTKNDSKMGKEIWSKTGPEASGMAYEVAARHLRTTELQKKEKTASQHPAARNARGRWEGKGGG